MECQVGIAAHARASSSESAFRNGRYFEISTYKEERETFVRDSSLEKEIVVFDNRIIGDNNVDSIVETGVDRKSGFVSANK